MYNRKNYKLLEYFVIFVDNLNFNNFKLLLYIMWQDFGLQTGLKLLLDIFLRWGSADVAVVHFGSKSKNKRKVKNGLCKNLQLHSNKNEKILVQIKTCRLSRDLCPGNKGKE